MIKRLLTIYKKRLIIFAVLFAFYITLSFLPYVNLLITNDYFSILFLCSLFLLLFHPTEKIVGLVLIFLLFTSSIASLLGYDRMAENSGLVLFMGFIYIVLRYFITQK